MLDESLGQELSDSELHELYTLGYNLYLSEAYDQSEALFQKITSLKPIMRPYWQGYASSLQMQKKYQEALLPWSMCVLIEEENPLPHYHAAECFLSLGEKEEAFKALTACENRDKESRFKEKISALRLAWEVPGG